MAFMAKRAERKQLKLRVALIGPSGAGKTYSALRLASGITGANGGKIALIDTENRRGEYYADEFTYDVISFDPPFSPERYIEAITYAEKAGYSVVIIDSASHEWMGAGGIMDTLDHIPGTNSYTKWAVLTPRHNAFIDKIVRSSVHIITCLRGKDEYVLETNDKGKQVPKKVGVGAQMRDGLEYECTVSLLIDQDKHTFSTMKDNTHIFDGRWDVLTEKDGVALESWASKGEASVEGLETSPDGFDAPSQDMLQELYRIAIEKGYDERKVDNHVSKRYECSPCGMTLDQYTELLDGYKGLRSEAS